MEVFNEISLLLLLYQLLLFSDFVAAASTRYDIGYAYMGITGANLFIHLLVQLVLGCYSLRAWLRRRKYRQMKKKIK